MPSASVNVNDVDTLINTFENRIMEFARNLIKFRRENPIFTSSDFVKSLTYHYDNGQVAQNDNEGYWNNCFDLFFGVLINSQEDRIYIATSKSEGKMLITLPENIEDKSWYNCLDTSLYNNTELSAKNYIEDRYTLNPEALAIFIER